MIKKVILLIGTPLVYYVLTAAQPVGSGLTWYGVDSGANAIGTGNTYIGHKAGAEQDMNTTRSYFSTMVGKMAGLYEQGSERGVYLGYGAGYRSVNNQDVIAIGGIAGGCTANCTNCIFIGVEAGNNVSNMNGAVIIGDVLVHTNGVTTIKGFNFNTDLYLPKKTEYYSDDQLYWDSETKLHLKQPFYLEDDLNLQSFGRVKVGTTNLQEYLSSGEWDTAQTFAKMNDVPIQYGQNNLSSTVIIYPAQGYYFGVGDYQCELTNIGQYRHTFGNSQVTLSGTTVYVDFSNVYSLDSTHTSINQFVKTQIGATFSVTNGAVNVYTNGTYVMKLDPVKYGTNNIELVDTVTTVVRETNGGIWDSELQVYWSPRMENGSLTYYATTNVNVTTGN